MKTLGQKQLVKFVVVAGGILLVLVALWWEFRIALSPYAVQLPIGWAAPHSAHAGDCYPTGLGNYNFPFSTRRAGHESGGPQYGYYCAPDSNRLAVVLNWAVGVGITLGAARLIARRKVVRQK